MLRRRFLAHRKPKDRACRHDRACKAGRVRFLAINRSRFRGLANQGRSYGKR